MESTTNALVSYNSPGVCDKLPQDPSPGPLQNCCEESTLSPTTDASLLDPSEDISQNDSPECLVNPSLPSELCEAECVVLRGDAIGNTAYTHRWVLNTLLKITQALPHYLTTEKTIEDTVRNCPETIIDEGIKNSENELLKSVDEGKDDSILELAEDVENAACQLWDMTAEPDVVHYLLSLSVIDIMQLAKDIITQSRAPRLTEVVVGVVANICCQAVGCEKVIGHESLLSSCLTLLYTTDDVPTLIEGLRLLRLLLWHITYRLAPQERSLSPVILALKNHESLKEALVFMLKNSLSDLLLSALCEFLEALMYIWLPSDQCYMAAYYSESGLVEGVVEVMRHFLKEWEKSGRQEQPREVHQGILILYSFMATPAVHIISSFDQYESLLEPILVRYVQHLAKVESVEEILSEDNAERLTYALGLCELLVPTMRHPNILLSIGKLLALTHGASHHYTAIQNQTLLAGNLEDDDNNQTSKIRHRRLSRSRSRRSRNSNEETMETDISVVLEKKESEEEVVDRTHRRRLSRSKSRSSRNSKEEIMDTDIPIVMDKERESEEVDSSISSKELEGIEVTQASLLVEKKEKEPEQEGVYRMRQRRISRSKSRRSRHSNEEMETDNAVMMEKKEMEKEKVGIDSSISTRKIEGIEATQKLSQKFKSDDLLVYTTAKENCKSSLLQNHECKEVKSANSSCALKVSDNYIGRDDTSAKKNTSAKLKSTVENLIDYCVRVVRCCPDLNAVLTALNECHAHEVQLFFRAVRSREPKLVGQLQEQLLDTGSHNRLVTILSDMYT